MSKTLQDFTNIRTASGTEIQLVKNSGGDILWAKSQDIEVTCYNCRVDGSTSKTFTYTPSNSSQDVDIGWYTPNSGYIVNRNCFSSSTSTGVYLISDNHYELTITGKKTGKIYVYCVAQLNGLSGHGVYSQTNRNFSEQITIVNNSSYSITVTKIASVYAGTHTFSSTIAAGSSAVLTNSKSQSEQQLVPLDYNVTVTYSLNGSSYSFEASVTKS